jgi:hypothetical protein
VPASCVHRPAAKAILNDDVFEPDTIAFMREHCGARDIVHAGTFFGDFLPALSAAIAPNALLWAFELNPESHLCAVWTMRLNNIANCRLHHAGLEAERGTAPAACAADGPREADSEAPTWALALARSNSASCARAASRRRSKDGLPLQTVRDAACASACAPAAGPGLGRGVRDFKPSGSRISMS